VVGGGLVGLATAWAVRSRRPDLSLAVLEKERSVGAHQSGHNSGVVHSGVYYRPGSLKARLTLEGRERLLAFAEHEHLPVGRIGKLIVATRKEELPALDDIAARGKANGVAGLERLAAPDLRARIPGLAGIAGLEVPSAAIVDFPAIAERLAEKLGALGARVEVGCAVHAPARTDAGWTLAAPSGDVRAGFVINCAGLQADRLAVAMGIHPPVAIVPYRGDFYRLSDRAKPPVHGEVLAGPNAALALAREGYQPGRLELEQLWEMAALPGLPKLVRNYGTLAAREWLKSWSPAQFLDAVRTLWPDATEADFVSRTSGVRAQAVRPDGRMEDDFVMVPGPAALHVLNAPSPAATASFAIGDRVADEAGFRAPARAAGG